MYDIIIVYYINNKLNMVATITKEEEELLIIPDEEVQESEMVLNIDEVKETEVDTEVISFWDEQNNETNTDNKAESIDLDFNLGWDDENVTVEEMLW